MKYLEKEIEKGRDLEKNLPQFMENMMQVYHTYSYVRFSMNYFTYYEMTGETQVKDKVLLSLTEELNHIVEKVLQETLSDEEQKDCIDRIDRLRNEVIHIMTGLTNRIDIFNIYEYCLNRMEYRYKDGSEFLKVTDEEMTRDILNYILSERDNVVINGKICEVVRQLPLRMTKGHFFELLKEGMKVYKESEKSSVDDLVYMLKTVSMLSVQQDEFKLSSEVEEVYQELEHTDFKNLEEETFDALTKKLSYAAGEIQSAVDHYMMLAENINDLYVILLSDCRIEENEDCKNCKKMIALEHQLFSGVPYGDVYEEIEDGFFYLEGKQEKYGQYFQKYDYLFDFIRENYMEQAERAGIHTTLDAAGKIQKMVSGSLFVEFLEDESAREIAGLDYIEQKYSELEQELTTFFANHPKNINRAVMAHILSELPVFFGNVDEIKNYIVNALGGCSDLAEKAAVIQILNSMVQEEL